MATKRTAKAQKRIGVKTSNGKIDLPCLHQNKGLVVHAAIIRQSGIIPGTYTISTASGFAVIDGKFHSVAVAIKAIEWMHLEASKHGFNWLDLQDRVQGVSLGKTVGSILNQAINLFANSAGIAV